MKKYLIALAFLLCFNGYAYADGEPAHVVLGGVKTIDGGNDSVFIQDDDPVEHGRPTSSITVLTQDWADRPVIYGMTPSERDGLLNRDEPVVIDASGSEFQIVTWGGEDTFALRVLDERGYAIIEDALNKRPHPAMNIKLTPEYRNYYIEFAQTEIAYDYAPESGYIPSGGSRESWYCYVLVKARGVAEAPKESVNPAQRSIEDLYQQLRRKDPVLNLNESEPVVEPEPESKDEQRTDTVPARRVRIKRDTEYTTD